MTRPNSLPEKYVLRYENVLYKNSTTVTATNTGWGVGAKYARMVTLPLKDIVNVAHELTVPLNCKRSPNVYKLAFVLGYLKTLDIYDPQNMEQQEALDSLIR